MEVVLTEFPIFNQAFTDTIIDALHDLHSKGMEQPQITQEVMQHPKVKKALQAQEKQRQGQPRTTTTPGLGVDANPRPQQLGRGGSLEQALKDL